MREAASGTVARFAVGLTDGISKQAVHAILAGVLDTPSLRLLCHEGEAEDLLAELAHHHLDLVLSSRPAPHNSNLRLSSERLLSNDNGSMGDLCTVPFLGSQGAIGPMELSHCDHRQRSCIVDDAGALVGFLLLAGCGHRHPPARALTRTFERRVHIGNGPAKR